MVTIGCYINSPKPHLVVHVQLPKSEAEFDNILGWCLGQNRVNFDYIEETFPSFVLLQASMRLNLHQVPRLYQKNDIVPCIMLYIGGMSMAQST